MPQNPIVTSMLAGYGPKFAEAFPRLEDLLAKQPSSEELLAMEMPIPGLGRYRKSTSFLTGVTSATAIHLTRFHVMKRYFLILNQALTETGNGGTLAVTLNDEDIRTFNTIGTTLAEAHQVDILEGFSEHDTAAAGDLLKLLIASRLPHLGQYIEGMHFACTSEDVMGNVFGLMGNELVYHHFMPEVLSFCQFVLDSIKMNSSNAGSYLLLPELTHNQAAEPTTLEYRFAVRVNAILEALGGLQEVSIKEGGFKSFSGKLGGAIGDLKCHYAAYPTLNWHSIARQFVEGLGLYYSPLTDQCVTYVREAQILSAVIGVIDQLIKFSQDFLDLARCPAQFVVKGKRAGQKGSSIMPNKSNLWQIEGAVVMLKKARAAIVFTEQELQNYPNAGNMGRSYLFRDIGNDFMPIFIALSRIRREMSSCHVNLDAIQTFFDRYPGMVGSMLQTVLKRDGITDDAYRLIQGIAINNDGTYANGQQFRERLEQAMEQITLPEAARSELRAIADMYITPFIQAAANHLRPLYSTIREYDKKRTDIRGLPEEIKTA